MSCAGATCTSPISDIPAVKPFIGSAWIIPNAIYALAKIARMQERWRQRQQLLVLDERLLTDIGLSRRDAIEEACKPFWK